MMDDSFCTQTAESYFSSSLDIVHVFPTEIMFLVFDWLDLESLCLCRSVSRTWRKHVNGYLGSLFCLDFVPHQSVLTEDGLRHMLKSVSNLRVLHVDNCWLSVTEENLFLIAQNCSKLSVLTASRCKGVTDVGLEAIARRCKELAEVDLSSCFTVCGQSLSQSHWTQSLTFCLLSSRLAFTSDGVEVVNAIVRALMTLWKSKIRVVSAVISTMELESEESEHFHFLSTPITTLALTFCLWSSENQIVRVGNRVRRINQSQWTFPPFVIGEVLPLLHASDSDNLVFTRS